jgi:ABC-type microcin C transport system permease subunit YejB
LLIYVFKNGQVGRYRETTNEYVVIDVWKQYRKEEALNLCAEHVEKAELPVSKNLKLWSTVLEFEELVPGIVYKCVAGHDFTD